MANQPKSYKCSVAIHAHNGKKIAIEVKVSDQPLQRGPGDQMVVDATLRSVLEEVIKSFGAYKVSEVDRIDLTLDTDRI